MRPEFVFKHLNALDMVKKEYSSDDRMYHSLLHINKMVEEYHNLVNSQKVLYHELDILIILFHDIVYRPNSSNNELNSANVAMKYMADLKYPKEHMNYVYDGIMTTKTHEKGIELNHNIISDIDMLYLSKPSDLYKLNVDAIKYEYLKCYTEDEWKEGRKAFLKGLLKKGYVYNTVHYYDCNEKAIENIQNEYNELEG